MSAPKRFSCAVVTGASSGIGLELCRLLAPRCTILLVVARRLDRLQSLAGEISPQGCLVHCIQADLEVAGGANDLWSRIIDKGFSPDLFVNNAGFGLYGNSLELPLQRELAMVELNISSLLVLTKLAASQMAKGGGGTVLNLASVAAFQPGPRMATYFATKSFVLSYSQALNEELCARGVRVLALCPGNTSTAFHTVAGTTRVKAMQKMFAMEAKSVARQGIRQIDSGKSVWIPGLLNQAMVLIVGLLPRKWVTHLSGQVLRAD
jgi:short-subunit dehydrogenase